MVKLGAVRRIVDPLQHYIKFPRIWIDNAVFRLHCKASALLLFGSCLLVSVGQFFGDPIDCIVEKDVPEGVMDTYCWIHSTFTLPKKVNSEIGWAVAHPGVGPVDLLRPTAEPGGEPPVLPLQNYQEETVEHRYYQWVVFTLFLQGVMFLFPYQLWKYIEGGKVASLIPDNLVHTLHDKRMPGFGTPANLVEGGKKVALVATGKIKDYFVTRHGNPYGYREHRHYFLKFAFCELMNLINVVVQLIFLNVFFNGVFTTYGSEVLSMSQMDPEDRRDPLDRVFPKVTKCTFEKYGPSGTIQRFDGLCVLSLNIINEKIYIMLFVWFVFLATVTAMWITWRLASIFSGRIREFILRGQSRLLAKPDDIMIVCNNLSLGDWFILVQIGNNIDTMLYCDVIHQIAVAFRKIEEGTSDRLARTEL